MLLALGGVILLASLLIGRRLYKWRKAYRERNALTPRGLRLRREHEQRVLTKGVISRFEKKLREGKAPTLETLYDSEKGLDVAMFTGYFRKLGWGVTIKAGKVARYGSSGPCTFVTFHADKVLPTAASGALSLVKTPKE